MKPGPRSFLVIQTAFIGDVILATALIEKLHKDFPEASIDFLLRRGNETLLESHPFLRRVLVWDKRRRKVQNLIALIREVRRHRYDVVINVHRFFSSGLITAFSGAHRTAGFDKNPLSFLFNRRAVHAMTAGDHEIDRNQKLIEDISPGPAVRPVLYPSASDFAKVDGIQKSMGRYLCVAPASVWFTKQFPREKWVEWITTLKAGSYAIFLLGAPSDSADAEFIRTAVKGVNVVNLAGKLTFLESAALMKGAVMNFVNDSAPLHLASAVNAPTAAVFCSTIPGFGFGPLSDVRHVIEITEPLDCRPCGLHGFRACPQGHFKCALTIKAEQLTAVLRVQDQSNQNFIR